MAARVFERQADMEQQREEWRVEVVKSKRKAIEVKKKTELCFRSARTLEAIEVLK